MMRRKAVAARRAPSARQIAYRNFISEQLGGQRFGSKAAVNAAMRAAGAAWRAQHGKSYGAPRVYRQ
jgi:hypothetical protein